MKQNPYDQLWVSLKIDLEEYEILKFFKENPDDDVRSFIHSSIYGWKNAEKILLIDGKWENKYFDLLNREEDIVWPKADPNNNFSRKLVWDKKTDKRWLLLISKWWLTLKDSIFEDISNIDTNYWIYFIYREAWKTLIRFVKNNKIISSNYSIPVNDSIDFIKKELNRLWITEKDIDNPNYKLSLINKIKILINTCLDMAKNDNYKINWNLDKESLISKDEFIKQINILIKNWNKSIDEIAKVIWISSKEINEILWL